MNSIQTAAAWQLGRTIVEHEQGGTRRAEYGERVLIRLSADLTNTFGRGYSVDSLQRMRSFYVVYPPQRIYATILRKLDKGETTQTLVDTRNSAIGLRNSVDPDTKIYATPLRKSGAGVRSSRFSLSDIALCFPLPWSSYIKLLSVNDEHARAFYETEALRSGWTVEQLDRQINSMFYERTALSRNKAAMLRKGEEKVPGDILTPEQEMKDPLFLEFLNLKDEYSESDLEEALIHHLESFLLELGRDFAFVGRQKRLRIDDEWYRVDLIFFHRRLRCLVLIDLKLGKLTHADAGQMHLYLNYAREHWANVDENPPVGLILCASKGASMARYALGGLPNKVLAAQYKVALPDAQVIEKELAQTCSLIERRKRLHK